MGKIGEPPKLIKGRLLEKSTMKEKLFYFLILISAFGGILGQEFEPDGKVKILPYERGQTKDLEVLGKDIAEFHKRIESRLAFLNKKNKYKTIFIASSYPRTKIKSLKVEIVICWISDSY